MMCTHTQHHKLPSQHNINFPPQNEKHAITTCMFACMRALERTMREWAYVRCVHTDMRMMCARACVVCVHGHVYDLCTSIRTMCTHTSATTMSSCIFPPQPNTNNNFNRQSIHTTKNTRTKGRRVTMYDKIPCMFGTHNKISYPFVNITSISPKICHTSTTTMSPCIFPPQVCSIFPPQSCSIFPPQPNTNNNFNLQ